MVDIDRGFFTIFIDSVTEFTWRIVKAYAAQGDQAAAAILSVQDFWEAHGDPALRVLLMDPRRAWWKAKIPGSGAGIALAALQHVQDTIMDHKDLSFGLSVEDKVVVMWLPPMKCLGMNTWWWIELCRPFEPRFLLQ